MAEGLRLFILAGEPSGDRLGADLVRALRREEAVDLTGVGGPALAAEGLEPLFDMDELAVMGLVDVLPRLPRLLALAERTAEAILAARPQIVVLIDAQGFSKAVAKRVRARGGRMPMLLMVAPTVWAWKPGRARKLRPLFDEILAVLPFEPAVMRQLGGPPTSYVGHPALAETPAATRPRLRGTLLLLPGSRRGELRRHLGLMGTIARRFAGHEAVERMVLPTLSALHAEVEAVARGWPAEVAVVSTPEERGAAFAEAVAAVAVSGTITLELALGDIPMVATYVSDPLQGLLWRLLSVSPFVSLPNSILGRAAVPEVLGIRPEPDEIAKRLTALLETDAGNRQRAAFAELRALMEQGAPDAPRQDAARRVLAHVRGQGGAFG